MIVAVTSEYHFLHGPDGVYTDATYPYAYWAGLLDVFDEVVIVARAAPGQPSPGHLRVDGPRVRVAAVRDFKGLAGLGAGLVSLAGVAARVARSADAAILRAPGVMATALHATLRLAGKPYGIEVVGDPAESLATADRSLHPLRTLAQRQLRAQVGGAAASLFVTRRTLQERYPPRAGTVTVSMSNVELPEDLFGAALPAAAPAGPLRLAFVGSLAQPYKGLDVLLAALAQTRWPHTLAVIGDGALRPALERTAAQLGIDNRVRFHGMVPARAVFEHLAAADLFVLPSRTEGMPRALIEAMAVGLPCLATPVGGVPELLDDESLVPVGQPAALARAIDDLAAAPDTRERLGRANRAVAHSFRRSEAVRARMTFRRAVRAAAARG